MAHEYFFHYSLQLLSWFGKFPYSKLNNKIKYRLHSKYHWITKSSIHFTANIIDNNKIWYYIGSSYNVVNSVQPYWFFRSVFNDGSSLLVTRGYYTPNRPNLNLPCLLLTIINTFFVFLYLFRCLNLFLWWLSCWIM